MLSQLSVISGILCCQLTQHCYNRPTVFFFYRYIITDDDYELYGDDIDCGKHAGDIDSE